MVNDNSSDQTESILDQLSLEITQLRKINNSPPNGFGMAVQCGLNSFMGDAVAIYMADASDRPEDLVSFFKTMQRENVDCVFGTRFSKQSHVEDYPWFKLILNRIVNTLIQILFGIRYNDVTNAFKLYHAKVIPGLKPFLSPYFNLTVELPLKAIVRGYQYAVVPNDWINRTSGESKLKIKEMGSRYFFIILYCLIEKLFSRGDYHRNRQLDQKKDVTA